jgi:hypothetical protein
MYIFKNTQASSMTSKLITHTYLIMFFGYPFFILISYVFISPAERTGMVVMIKRTQQLKFICLIVA